MPAGAGQGAADRTARRLILVLGGARSGKSRYAEARFDGLPGPLAYVATAEALDGEMAERLAGHRARRDARWVTHEAPLDLAAVITALPQDTPVLLDCLTLWLSNHLLDDHDLAAAGEELVAALGQRQGLTIVVTNEVGFGIVPDNALARRFRDAAGRLNQQVAAIADEAVLVVAGLPLMLKGGA